MRELELLLSNFQVDEKPKRASTSSKTPLCSGTYRMRKIFITVKQFLNVCQCFLLNIIICIMIYTYAGCACTAMIKVQLCNIMFDGNISISQRVRRMVRVFQLPPLFWKLCV